MEVSRLDEWEKRLENEFMKGKKPSRKMSLPDEGVDVGITPAPIVFSPFIAEASQAFIKFFGENNSRAERGDSTFNEVKRSGCHWACTYPIGKRPRQVEDGAVIFMGRMVRKPNDIIIYGRAIGIHYQEGRDDATTADIELRSWKKRWPHYIRVHHPEFLAGSLGNGISLFKLMDDLKSDVFSSTKMHNARGKGNINPRTAYRQLAAVKLSNEGYSCLNNRLEAVFQQHGKLAQAELDQLDWPK